MTFSAQVLANQATIIQNQSVILASIQAITPGGSEAIIAALAQMETQIVDIQQQVDVAPATPTPTPDAPPAA